jgi:serine/threonine protein kinase
MHVCSCLIRELCTSSQATSCLSHARQESWNALVCQSAGELTLRCGGAAVLPFAKRGDDRSNNLVRLQQLFPRIVAADYEQPRRVSEECRHLLKRMLTPDPNKRVTIPEIMQHSWSAPASCLEIYRPFTSVHDTCGDCAVQLSTWSKPFVKTWLMLSQSILTC